MYCPICLNDSLFLKSKGTVFIKINNHRTTHSHFLYNLAREEEEDIVEHIIEKIDEFLEFYKNFDNKQRISKVEISSTDFSCDKHCKIPVDARFSTVGILIDKKHLINVLTKLTRNHGLALKLESIG